MSNKNPRPGGAGLAFLRRRRRRQERFEQWRFSHYKMFLTSEKHLEQQTKN